MCCFSRIFSPLPPLFCFYRLPLSPPTLVLLLPPAVVTTQRYESQLKIQKEVDSILGKVSHVRGVWVRAHRTRLQSALLSHGFGRWDLTQKQVWGLLYGSVRARHGG